MPHKVSIRLIVTALAGDSKMDHGTNIRDAITIIVRKDNWIPAKPWFADVVFPDGHKWRGWQEFYSTKKSLLQAINAAAPNATVEFQ
mgnify:CR=1 FL=1